jgi:hypothetical protein
MAAIMSGAHWLLGQQPPPSVTGTELRNEDVLKMVKAGLDDSIIISKIKVSRTQFDTSTDTLIALKQSGLSSAVLKAMTEASVQPLTEARSQSEASSPALPKSYGCFLLDGTRYQPLTPTKISVVVGLALRTGGNSFAVDGFDGDPPQSAVAALSELLLYQQNVDIASVRFARLEFVRSLQAHQFNIATAVNPQPNLYPALFGVEYNQVIPVDLWRPLAEGVPFHTEPVIERNGMFRLIAESSLSPGRYAIFVGDSIHASGMIFATSGGQAGTGFYFEVRPPGAQGATSSPTPYTGGDEGGELTSAWNKALELGKPVEIGACRAGGLIRGGRTCGTLSLSHEEVSFTQSNGQKVFAVPPSQVKIKGVDLPAGVFSLEVGGKVSTFAYVPTGVDCPNGACPEEGLLQQKAVAVYVAQTIRKLAHK